jgi:hypothetical protein
MRTAASVRRAWPLLDDCRQSRPDAEEAQQVPAEGGEADTGNRVSPRRRRFPVLVLVTHAAGIGTGTRLLDVRLPEAPTTKAACATFKKDA